MNLKMKNKITKILGVVFICYFLFLGSLIYFAMSNDVQSLYTLGVFEILCTLALIVLYLEWRENKKVKKELWKN